MSNSTNKTDKSQTLSDDCGKFIRSGSDAPAGCNPPVVKIDLSDFVTDGNQTQITNQTQPDANHTSVIVVNNKNKSSALVQKPVVQWEPLPEKQ